MKCQECGINTATTHVKAVTNGEFAEYMLCPECAAKKGYTNIFNDITADFSNLLGGFFTNALPARTQATRCPACGSSLSEISKCGQVGCAICYETFADELLPSIRRMHGNTQYSGKKSKQNKTESKKDIYNRKLRELNKKLEKAIEDQDFENAAKIRDEIKEMKVDGNEK